MAYDSDYYYVKQSTVQALEIIVMVLTEKMICSPI